MKHALNRGSFSKVILIVLFEPVLADPLMVAIAIGYGDVCTIMPLVLSACKAFLLISSSCFTLLFCSLVVDGRSVNVCSFKFFLRFFNGSFPSI